jgi:zinc protease
MSFEKRVIRTPVGPVDLAVLPTGVLNVVTVRGSMDTWPDFAGSGELVQEWAAITLDKGTTRQDRFELGEKLENLGARISFRSAGSRLRFSARMLKPDVPAVLAMLFEQLWEPAFEKAELDKSRDRLAASLQRSRSEAGYRANAALSSSVFPAGHPNAMRAPDEELELLSELVPDAPRDFHREGIRARPLRMAVVGDVDLEVCQRAIEACTRGWKAADRVAPTIELQEPSGPGETRISIPDRDNLEVRWGHSIPILRGDPDFLPTYVANFILGGNFSARLMNIVRDEQGLTYGVGSGLSGVHTRYSGMWHIHITLSRENLSRGIDSTRKVIADYVRAGATSEEAAIAVETISGSYQVKMATTGGLASAILQQMEEERPMSYLDDYPSRVRGVTEASVNEVLTSFFEPQRLYLAVAGSLPE